MAGFDFKKYKKSNTSKTSVFDDESEQDIIAALDIAEELGSKKSTGKKTTKKTTKKITKKKKTTTKVLQQKSRIETLADELQKIPHSEIFEHMQIPGKAEIKDYLLLHMDDEDCRFLLDRIFTNPRRPDNKFTILLLGVLMRIQNRRYSELLERRDL